MYRAVRAFEDLPTNAPSEGEWPGINVPWSMPRGIPNSTPWCSWDCPRNANMCSADESYPRYRAFLRSLSSATWMRLALQARTFLGGTMTGRFKALVVAASLAHGIVLFVLPRFPSLFRRMSRI